MRYVYCLESHYDHEGSQLHGIFASATVALKWAEEAWPKVKWRKSEAEQVWPSL
jgi:hypothetical protein